MRKTLGLIFIMIFIFSVFVTPVLADDAKKLFNESLKKTAEGSGHDQNAFANKDIGEVIGQGIKIFLSLLGIIFLFLMIYGGFVWMNSRGNEQEVTRASSIIRNSLIGLIIVLGAYAITAFVGSFFN